VTCIILQRNANGHSPLQASMKANLTHCLAVHMNMHEKGLWLAKMITALSAIIDPLDQFLNTSAIALPSTGAEGGLLCKGACSPFPRRHAVLTSDHRTYASGPTCSALICQSPNPMNAVAVLITGHRDPDRITTKLICVSFAVSCLLNRKHRSKETGTKP
jgi:hypothetical protein